MAQITRENVGLLTDKITVTLNKEDYYPAFEKALKTYSKQARIPGFRPGMVPMPVVKKMYGSSVFTDEILRTVEKEINQYLTQEQPDIFGQPLPLDENADTLRNLDMNLPGDYAFGFEIGLRPAFSPASLSSAVINRRKVLVTDEMVDEEVKRLQNRYGNMKEPETVDQDDNVLNVHFAEVDADGNPVEDGIAKDNSLLVKYFAEAVRPQLIGLKKDDSIVVVLNDAFEEKEREWIMGDLGLEHTEGAGDKSFRITITKIGLVETRELNEEFFEQLFPGKAIATEAEFRAAIKADVEAYWLSQGRNQIQDEIYHYLVDHTQMEFPEVFLKKWIMSGGEKQKTAEEAEKEYPSFINSLKWTMISDRLIGENNLQVQPDELRAFATQQMMGYMGITQIDDSTAWLNSYVDRMMQDRKYIDKTYNDLLTNKLFTWAESQVQYKDTEVSREEFEQHTHHHHH
jgi:trigger factor